MKKFRETMFDHRCEFVAQSSIPFLGRVYSVLEPHGAISRQEVSLRAWTYVNCCVFMLILLLVFQILDTNPTVRLGKPQPHGKRHHCISRKALSPVPPKAILANAAKSPLVDYGVSICSSRRPELTRLAVPNPLADERRGHVQEN